MSEDILIKTVGKFSKNFNWKYTVNSSFLEGLGFIKCYHYNDETEGLPNVIIDCWVYYHKLFGVVNPHCYSSRSGIILDLVKRFYKILLKRKFYDMGGYCSLETAKEHFKGLKEYEV